MPDPMCISAAKIRARYSCSLRVAACVSGLFSKTPQPARLIGTSYWALKGILVGLHLPRAA
jgi:hypothetical protein